jgi:hypothetical protein
LRLLSGERARVESGTTGRLEAMEHPALGRGWRVADGLSPGDSLSDADDFEIDLIGFDESTVGHARAVLEFALDAEASTAILELAQAPFEEWSAYVVRELPQSLEQLGCRSFDSMVSTYREGGTFCRRNVRFVVSDRWLISIWSPPIGGSWDRRLPRLFALAAGRGREHARTPIQGTTGHDRLARVISDILRHHEYAGELVELDLERWEERVYEALAQQRALDHPAELQFLSRVGAFLAALNEGGRNLRRRAETQPGFPAAMIPEAVARSEDLRRQIGVRRRELREAHSLLHNAATNRQLELAEEQQKLDRAFNFAAGIVTAFVLVPSLVVALYSAQITGLPGMKSVRGLEWIGVLSTVGAALTIGSLMYIRKRASRTA